MENATQKNLLFSYGTLRQDNVQMAIFGCHLMQNAAIVTKYKLREIEILDKDVIAKSGKKYHKIMEYTGNLKDEIAGAVFELTPQQLKMADAYEVDDYIRKEVSLKSGDIAWAYVAKDFAT